MDFASLCGPEHPVLVHLGVVAAALGATGHFYQCVVVDWLSVWVRVDFLSAAFAVSRPKFVALGVGDDSA